VLGTRYRKDIALDGAGITQRYLGDRNMWADL